MTRMLDFRERTQLRKTMYAKPTILFLGVIVLLIARGAWGMYEKSVEASVKRDKAAAELEHLQTYATQLDTDISKLSSERGQEAEIRDRFMVAKDGENVIVVTSAKQNDMHTVTVSEEPETMVDRLKAAVGTLRP